MISNLKTLRESVIFLVISTTKLLFIRFQNGKILSSKHYDISSNASSEQIKVYFRDYLGGKEGIPVCILFDIPNQSFTEYKFLKSISQSAVHQSIIKKISNDISQEAIHDYINIQDKDGTKKGENIFQVTSLVKTPLVSYCIDLLHKFPNPVAGYFSMIMEMSSICDGTSSIAGFQKPEPIVEQDSLDIRDKHNDDINIAIEYVNSIINFSLYQGKRILFQHSITCPEVTDEIQKEITSTISTVTDYAKQLNKEYYIYVYGEQSFLRNILETSTNPKLIYFLRSDSHNPKTIYHRGFITQSASEINPMHIAAYKCLHDASHFIENKEFFSTHAKYKMIKLASSFSLFALCTLAVYECFVAYPALVSIFGDKTKMPEINITTVTNNISNLEKTMIKKKHMMALYTSLANDSYSQFRTNFDTLLTGETHVNSLLYTCKNECNSSNAELVINVNGKTKDMTSYFAFISQMQRSFYNHSIEKQSTEDKKTNNINFKIDISSQTINTQGL